MLDKDSNVKAGAPRIAKALDRWHRIECWLAFCAFIFISLVIIYDVIAREILVPVLHGFDVPTNKVVMSGASKLGVYALIAGAFIGLGVATASGAQIVPKVAFRWTPAAWELQINRISDIFAGLFFLGATWVGTVFVLSSKQYGMLTSGGINVEVWIIQTIIPLGFASVGLRYLIYAIWPAHRPALPEISE